MKIKKAHFFLYRYQLLPVDRHFQGDFLDGVKSVGELINRKNEFFADVLNAIHDFNGGQTEVVTKAIASRDDFRLYQIAANRSLNREKSDFTAEELDNWPSIYVAIWNEPDRQLIAVQKRPAAFQKPETVMRLIADAVDPVLGKRQLRFVWEPLFEKKVFWDLVARYEGKIQAVDFEIITPNMANISGGLSDDLKDFAKATNSTKNKISIQSDANSSLKIEKTNSTVEGLVDYSSNGGGDITLRIAGAKKRIRTSKTVKEVEVDELSLQGSSDSIVTVLKGIIS